MSKKNGQHRVLEGHVSIRNPLQAAKQRSCGFLEVWSRFAEPAAYGLVRGVVQSYILRGDYIVFVGAQN